VCKEHARTSQSTSEVTFSAVTDSSAPTPVVRRDGLFCDGFEVPVDVLRITLLTNADTAYDYHMVLRINSVNDAMVAELVLPIASQQAAQWQPVFLPARSLRGRSSRFSVFS